MLACSLTVTYTSPFGQPSSLLATVILNLSYPRQTWQLFHELGPSRQTLVYMSPLRTARGAAHRGAPRPACAVLCSAAAAAAPPVVLVHAVPGAMWSAQTSPVQSQLPRSLWIWHVNLTFNFTFLRVQSTCRGRLAGEEVPPSHSRASHPRPPHGPRAVPCGTPQQHAALTIPTDC